MSLSGLRPLLVHLSLSSLSATDRELHHNGPNIHYLIFIFPSPAPVSRTEPQPLEGGDVPTSVKCSTICTTVTILPYTPIRVFR